MFLFTQPDCIGRKFQRKEHDRRKDKAQQFARPIPISRNDVESFYEVREARYKVVEREINGEEQRARHEDPFVGYLCDQSQNQADRGEHQ